MKKKIIDKKHLMVFSISFFLTFALIVVSLHFCKFLESDPMTWREIGDDIGGILFASFIAAIISVFKYEDVTNN